MNKMTENSNNLPESEAQHLQGIVQDVLQLAKKKGATAAEASASVSAGLSVTVRLGEVDVLEFNRSKGVGVTVYFDHSKGNASSSDTSAHAIESTVDAACAIAKVTTADKYAGLADSECMANDYPDCKLHHVWSLNPEEAIQLARECEAEGRAVDKRIRNSEGASVYSNEMISVYGNSHGFIGTCPSTRHSVNCILVASENDEMQRDYYYTSARDRHDLENFSHVATTAAERTVARLGSRRLKTQQVPVLFSAEMARNLLGTFTSAISGGSLYRQASFLLDHLGKKIFPEFVQINEQPHLEKAIGSAPFDNDGVRTQDRDLVKDGVLQGYILSAYTARKLGMQTTGNSGGVHNLTIEDTGITFDGLLKKMGTGLFVTEMMGHGVNIVTGDYSRGACGFWVEKGEIQYPVHEITIAGNLRDIFQGIVGVGNDIDIRSSIRSGSILIDNMMIAGE